MKGIKNEKRRESGVRCDLAVTIRETCHELKKVAPNASNL
jgi:hypothetical protein